MFDLFDDTPEPDLLWEPAWLDSGAAAQALARILAEVDWRQDEINTPAGRIPLPRLTAWQGEPDAVYVYSGIRNVPAPWSPAVAALRDAVSDVGGVRFNSVLLNRYRNGTDSMGWHTDDEPELGPEPVIASVSLGAARRFDLRHNATGVTRSFLLGSGSLLVMRGQTQAQWRHRVPKEPAVRGERVNLTFRVIEGARR
ncbi:alpha-ketoglutarate-dependent dioxygenase AlkB [Burkholderia sp. WAC0059]|uniref:alpha-ketoglutarate-dependent dioxygenase AlkB family protein n=1 Tax=Burkholderia sp. WAC0059 TaxID=2066022 RepID=UPI000C7F6636|nr:alpha-ketoglutarate-dependent dioxygenase AlkB [Burkholderia sp. WAC0059]PLZ03792.1 alpha-ketoglutarate-dependent dioxygenase AlkB [Burkholderia sp. WAC0059]